MRIIYVPRRDAAQVVGGDIIAFMQIKKRIQRLGVEVEIVAVDQLQTHAGGDLLHLTQIYQLDVAESALDWAQSKGMPVTISPLFEDLLPMCARRAIKRQAKWCCLARVGGAYFAERLYTRWQTARRIRNAGWLRQRLVLERAHVVPNTRYELHHLQQWFKLPDLTGLIVPLGVDSELYGGWKATDVQNLPSVLGQHCGRYVLEVGLISMRKNQAGLLRALARTADPIVFLGRPNPYEPEYGDEVKALAKTRGNVVFLEYVDEELLPTLYGNARVHVLPSWSERPGMVSLEAAACGCKVISTNRAPIHEYLEQRAWYVDPSCPDDIRDTVQLAMQSGTPRGLREHALAYSWEKTAEKLADAYSTILAENASGR